MDEFSSENLESLANQAIEMTMLYLPKLLLAVVTLIIGFWIISKTNN